MHIEGLCTLVKAINREKYMQSFIASGGEELLVDNYKVHIFNKTDYFVVIEGESKLELFLVGGGGSGGEGDSDGGGGGGVLKQVTPGVVRPGKYLITVGLGGEGGSSGSDSAAFGFKAFGGQSALEELGIVSWSASSDKSSIASDISGVLKHYAGSGGNNLPNTEQADLSGQYENGGGGGHGSNGSGFAGTVIIRYEIEN